MKGSHGTLSCSESLYLEGDTSLTGPGIVRLSELSILQKNKNKASRAVSMGPRMLLERWTQVRLEGPGLTTHRQAGPDASSLPLKIHFQKKTKENIYFIMLTKSVRDPTKNETLISVTNL